MLSNSDYQRFRNATSREFILPNANIRERRDLSRRNNPINCLYARARVSINRDETRIAKKKTPNTFVIGNTIIDSAQGWPIKYRIVQRS